MTALMEDKDTYLSSFARFERTRAGDRPALAKLRQDAIERFTALGFPTLEDEDWRFTPLSALTRLPFDVKLTADRDPGNFRLITDEDLQGSRLMLFNGAEPISQH